MDHDQLARLHGRLATLEHLVALSLGATLSSTSNKEDTLRAIAESTVQALQHVGLNEAGLEAADETASKIFNMIEAGLQATR